MSEQPIDRRPAIDRGLITREHRAELIALGCVEPGTEEPIDDDKIGDDWVFGVVKIKPPDR